MAVIAAGRSRALLQHLPNLHVQCRCVDLEDRLKIPFPLGHPEDSRIARPASVRQPEVVYRERYSAPTGVLALRLLPSMLRSENEERAL